MSGAALFHALDLMHRPMLAGVMREQGVPPGVLLLIHIAAGDETAMEAAGRLTQEPPARIREAAVLYLQHVLLGGADNYRALGVERDAPSETLREHFVGLMKWLHPDRTKTAWESAFAKRVLEAWEALKTPERRAAYDRTLGVDAPPTIDTARRRQKVYRPAQPIPWIRQRSGPRRSRFGRGAVVVAAGAVLALLVWSGQQRLAADSAAEQAAVTGQASTP